eukprot:sb/3468280/
MGLLSHRDEREAESIVENTRSSRRENTIAGRHSGRKRWYLLLCSTQLCGMGLSGTDCTSRTPHGPSLIIPLFYGIFQEPTETSKQPIRTRYLGHVSPGYQSIRDQYPTRISRFGRFIVYSKLHIPIFKKTEPTVTSKQPIRTHYLGHVTSYQPIRDQYLITHIWEGNQGSVDQLPLGNISHRITHANLPVNFTHSLTRKQHTPTQVNIVTACPNMECRNQPKQVNNQSVFPDSVGSWKLVIARSEQPIRTRYLGHVTGYQPIRDQ